MPQILTTKANKPSIQPRGYSPHDAARYVGVGRNMIYHFAALDYIRIHKIGNRSIIFREDLDKFLDGVKAGTIKIAPRRGATSALAPEVAAPAKPEIGA